MGAVARTLTAARQKLADQQSTIDSQGRLIATLQAQPSLDADDQAALSAMQSDLGLDSSGNPIAVSQTPPDATGGADAPPDQSSTSA